MSIVSYATWKACLKNDQATGYDAWFEKTPNSNTPIVGSELKTSDLLGSNENYDAQLGK